jgi:hypothetical protein
MVAALAFKGGAEAALPFFIRGSGFIRGRRAWLRLPLMLQLLKPSLPALVTLSPHSKVNQTMFGKDMAGVACPA